MFVTKLCYILIGQLLKSILIKLQFNWNDYFKIQKSFLFNTYHLRMCLVREREPIMSFQVANTLELELCNSFNKIYDMTV